MSILNVYLITFPNIPKLNTGRGIDAYLYYLSYHLKNKVNLHYPSLESANNFISLLKNDMSFFFEVLKSKSDVYHAVSEYSVRYAISSRKKPLITTFHDFFPFFFKYKNNMLQNLHSNARYINFKLALKSDLLVMTSNFYARYLSHKMKIDLDKIRVIHYGTDHKMFFPEKHVPKCESRREKIVIYIGSISRLKGIFALLKAFKKVSKEMDNVYLYVGGKGPDLDPFKEAVCNMLLENKVKLLGFVDSSKLRELYNLADVFVWPSHFGFGLPILDAMACGTPVIASDALDAPEYLGNGGLLFRDGDYSQLAHFIIKVLSDNECAEELKLRAISQAKLFSWEKMANEFLKIYDNI